MVGKALRQTELKRQFETLFGDLRGVDVNGLETLLLMPPGGVSFVSRPSRHDRGQEEAMARPSGWWPATPAAFSREASSMFRSGLCNQGAESDVAMA